MFLVELDKNFNKKYDEMFFKKQLVSNPLRFISWGQEETNDCRRDEIIIAEAR